MSIPALYYITCVALLILIGYTNGGVLAPREYIAGNFNRFQCDTINYITVGRPIKKRP